MVALKGAFLPGFMTLRLQDGRAMFFKFLRLALITFSLTFSGTTVSEVAFIGDSISTGAVTNSKLSFNVANLWDYFTGKTYDGEVQTFKRLWPSRRDYRSPVEWVLKNIFMAFSTIYLDDESLSWSAQVGHDLGFDKNGILIAAEDGARVRNSISQIDKIFERTDYKIPEKVFYFFTGNDLCGPTLDFITSGEEYGRKVEDSFRYMMRNGKSAGSDVYVVGNMNVLQLVVGEAILSKEVDAHGKKITCKELREFNEPYAVDVDKDPNKAVFFSILSKKPCWYVPHAFW